MLDIDHRIGLQKSDEYLLNLRSELLVTYFDERSCLHQRSLEPELVSVTFHTRLDVYRLSHIQWPACDIVEYVDTGG